MHLIIFGQWTVEHTNAAGLGSICNSMVVQSLAERDNMRKSTTNDNRGEQLEDVGVVTRKDKQGPFIFSL